METKTNALTNGSPLAADSIERMTDTSKIYVNTTDGYWYYYNGSSWTKGDIYQSERVSGAQSTLFWNLEESVQRWIDVQRGEMVDLSAMTRNLGYYRASGVFVSGDVDNNLYGHYIFGDVEKGELIYITYGVSVALMPLYIIRRKSDNSIIQAYPSSPITGTKDYKKLLIQIPEDNCELIIQDSTVYQIAVFRNNKMKRREKEDNNIKLYQTEVKDNLGNLDQHIIDAIGTDWEELDWKKDETLLSGITAVYDWARDYLRVESHSQYDTYTYPLVKGETYLFTGGDLYLVPGICIVDSSMQLRAASSYRETSVQVTTGSYLIYTCKEDNLTAYISLPKNTSFSNCTYFAKLKGTVDKKSKTLLKEYDKTFFASNFLSAVDNIFNSAQGFKDYTRGRTLQYLMNKGITYKIFSYNWALVQAVVITDLAGNILYRSSTTNTNGVYEPINYTWTADQMGYIFLSDNFTGDEQSYATLDIVSDDTIITKSINNPLYEKTAIFDGDSICQGDKTSAYNKYGWAGRIGTSNNMTWKNYGVGGGTVVTDTYYYTKVTDTSSLDWENTTYYKHVSGASATTDMYQVVSESEYNGTTTLFTRGGPRHWESTYLDTMYAEYPNADYVILESDLNDGFNTVPLGEVSSTFNETYVTTNFSSAMEYMLSRAIKLWPRAKIGVIIPYRVKNSNIPRYHEKTREACQKWGVPYLDLEKESGINPNISEQLAIMFTDTGTHVNATGYDFIHQKIESWMKTL